jgi:hypothetical protein
MEQMVAATQKRPCFRVGQLFPHAAQIVAWLQEWP